MGAKLPPKALGAVNSRLVRRLFSWHDFVIVNQFARSHPLRIGNRRSGAIVCLTRRIVHTMPRCCGSCLESLCWNLKSPSWKILYCLFFLTPPSTLFLSSSFFNRTTVLFLTRIGKSHSDETHECNLGFCNTLPISLAVRYSITHFVDNFELYGKILVASCRSEEHLFCFMACAEDLHLLLNSPVQVLVLAGAPLWDAVLRAVTQILSALLPPVSNLTSATAWQGLMHYSSVTVT